MSFFIDMNRTRKIYFTPNMDISEKETEEYIEIMAEPSIEIVEDIKAAIKPKNVKISKDQTLEVDTAEIGFIPLETLMKVIRGWSESVPLTKDLLKTKTNPKILRKLWEEILRAYGLSNDAFGIF
jgi:Zn-dependent M16 (insulinase) family peptidase